MLRYLIIDVDGTLTDGGIYYDTQGNEVKKFCTKDGTGLSIARAAGIKLVIMTGRECEATRKRMEELHVDFLYQGIKDKFSFLKSWILENDVKKEELGYIGDDINDLAPMKLCDFIGCPADACEEVKMVSNYVSTINGGHGAVRNVIENYLKEHHLWEQLVENTYGNTGV
ncbi:MAG: HAD hydrolase family protein [Eubacterium sp.]|nr:HAD hydrolase family protein [Eubacterium sp.]